jgi:hypothetical protein
VTFLSNNSDLETQQKFKKNMHHEEIELNFDTSCQQILGLESEILWEACSTPTLSKVVHIYNVERGWSERTRSSRFYFLNRQPKTLFYYIILRFFFISDELLFLSESSFRKIVQYVLLT